MINSFPFKYQPSTPTGHIMAVASEEVASIFPHLITFLPFYQPPNPPYPISQPRGATRFTVKNKTKSARTVYGGRGAASLLPPSPKPYSPSR